jgi:hypothetical protein
MPQSIVKPTNQIVAAGDPFIVEMEIGANATVAKVVPGRVVIFDDADQTVKECGAKADGWVGIIEVSPDGTKTAQPAVGDQVPIILGQCLAVVTLLASENVTRGDPLVTAADGKVAKQAVGAMGSQGRVIGFAWESSNVTTDASILMQFCPCGAEPAAAS